MEKPTAAEKLRDLVRIASHLAQTDGTTQTSVPGLRVCRETHTSAHCEPKFSKPVIALCLQGKKELVAAGRTCRIEPGTLVIHASALPTDCFVTQASLSEPFLSLVVDFDIALLRRLLERLPETGSECGSGFVPFFSSQADSREIEAFSAIVELTQSPAEAALMLPALTELFYAALILGTQGGWMRRLASVSGTSRRVMTAVAFLRTHLAEEISMDSLARNVGMSSPTFFRHFRAFAGCSPNQYLKRLRLHTARHLLQSTGCTVSYAAATVGYKSASQFSCDYRKTFGAPARTEAGRGCSA